MFNTQENHIAYFITINEGPVAESPMFTNQISISDNCSPAAYVIRNLGFNVYFHSLYTALSSMLLLHRESPLYKMLQQYHLFIAHRSPCLSFYSERNNFKIRVIVHFIRNRNLLHSRLQNLKPLFWLSKLEPRDFVQTRGPDRVYFIHFF